jgi:tripartite-type tricarboxylate transporter receptor subunit TctC
VGASAHLAAELLKSLAGIDITHVPYPGGAGPGVQATIAGQTQLTFASPAGATMAAIEEGQLRALAVSSATRWDGMPDLPTVAEQGVDGFEVDYWTALFAPAGTPPDIVEKISSAVRTALDDPVLSEQYSKLHYSKPYQSPQEFGAYVEKDVEKWGRIIKSANIPL